MKSTNRMKTEALTLMHLDGKRKYIGTGNNIYRKVVINPTSEDDVQKFCRNYFRIYNFSLYNFIRRLISLDAIIVYSLFLTVYVFSEISQGITKKYIFIDTAISLFLNISILVVTETLYELKQLKDIKDANSQCYLRIVPKMSHFEKVTTKEIKVGDIIRVFQGDEFPADAVILYVKNNLNAMVDSFKIDGLFRKSIKYPVDKYKIDRDYLKMLSEINGFIRCELPNKNIFCFQGNFKLDKHPRSLMLSYENFALQSSILKGAEYIDAVVIYTGADTKKNLNIPQKTEENRTFCIKMNNVVYYLIFMYFFFVLLSIIIKLTFYRTSGSHQRSKDTFLTVLEDFIGLYILVLPIMIYSEKSLIYIIQSLKIENDLRMKEGPHGEKPKVFNKNKNDALGAVDLLATTRNGILVKKKDLFVSCAVNNVVYAKCDFVYSGGEIRLPTLNILDGERRNVAELLNLDERIFKDPENVLFPSRDLGLFLRIFQNRITSIYDPFADDLSMVLSERYRSYFKEEILNKNVMLTPIIKAKLNGGYNQFYENFKNSYNCKEVIEDAQRGEDQADKIEEFVFGICACNRVIIYNEKCLDMGIKEYKSESYNDAYVKYEKENKHEIENEKNYKHAEKGDEENFHTIEYEDICLYNIVKNIGYHVYCYKNRLFFYNLKDECQEYHLICFHDFLKSNKFSMCILKHTKELDQSILYVRGYDFNLLPYLSLAKNDIRKIKKIIKMYTMNYLKVILICKKVLKNEDIGKYLLLKSIRNSNKSRLSFKLYDLMKIFLLNDLEVVGMIGLKNDLKEGVEETFLDLAKFDIRSWIFTNEYSKDTYLTGLQCNLIPSNSNLFVINFFNPHGEEADERVDSMDNMDSMANALFNNFTLSLDKLNSTSYAIAINDASIRNIMSNAHAMKMFLCIAMRATVVLFCKMDNETKGKVIRKVLSLTTPRLTILGVGSTLNDAYLLKNTTISVCLSLNEQVNVLYSISDYVLHEFRYIIDLLILGRLNKFSLSRSFLWIIYLKITIVSLYFFHNFDNFFSGSSTSSILYTQTTFAIFHYLLIIAFSAYEIDLPYKFIRSVPYIYQLARRKYFLNNTIIILTILEAMLISMISYYILRVHVFPLITHRAFTFHIFILNFFITSEKILLLSRTWHLYFFILAVLIICFLFLYVNVYTLIDCFKIGKCELSLFQTEDAYFWLSLLPILYINFFIDKAAKFINNRISPDITEYFREKILKKGQKGSSKKNTTEGNLSANLKDRANGALDLERNATLTKFIPTPKQYSIREKNKYYNRTKKTKFIYETFRRVIGLNIKYRNQQLNLEYKTYEKRTKLKLRTIGIVLFVIFFIIFSVQAIVSKCTKEITNSLNSLTYFLILYYFLATVWMIYIRLRNRSNSTLFFFIGKMVLIFGFILELYDNVSNDMINMLIGYSFTVSYIFFLSFKILEEIIICTLLLVFTSWVYYRKNKMLSSMCTKFCENPYLSLHHLEEVNISCLCKQQVVTFLICILSFTFICLSMKYYEIYYLKKKFLFRYKQKVNLTKQIEILHTMLPSFLVEYLLISDPKADGIMVGKNISGEDRGIISVIFCDIDDFQSMVSTLEPHALVETLDNLYLYFDKCIKYFNCIKIETVFESYLAASGLSEKQNDCVHKIKYDTRCAIKLAIAQLSAKYYISYKVLDGGRNNVGNANLGHSSSYTLPMHSGDDSQYDKYTHKNISLRIGIHTGKAISGVIGSVKPQYSLFGDTVNTASRMKSTALTDHIHVSYDTYKYLEDDTSLVWKKRKVFIKGKGEMRTYLLVDILDDVKKVEEPSDEGFSSSTLVGGRAHEVMEGGDIDNRMVEGGHMEKLLVESGHIDNRVVERDHIDNRVLEGGHMEDATKKSHPKKKTQKERRRRENPHQINAQSTVIEKMLDIYERGSDSCRKDNWYYYNKADNASDSMISNNFPSYSRAFNDTKSKYLSLDKVKLADSVRRKKLYDFESPVSLRKEIIGGRDESDEFFTSPYVEDEHQVERIKKVRRSNACVKKDSSDFMHQFDTPDGAIKNYIKERRNYQRKFYAPHFYLGDILKTSSKFKKGEKKRRGKKQEQARRRQATHEEGVSYNFVNGSFSSNWEYSTESEFYLYDEKLRQNKGYINFDDLFTKIYRKKRNILQGDIQHIPRQGFLFPKSKATKGGRERRRRKKKLFPKEESPCDDEQNGGSKSGTRKQFFRHWKHEAERKEEDIPTKICNDPSCEDVRNGFPHSRAKTKGEQENLGKSYTRNSPLPRRSSSCLFTKRDDDDAFREADKWKGVKNVKRENLERMAPMSDGEQVQQEKDRTRWQKRHRRRSAASSGGDVTQNRQVHKRRRNRFLREGVLLGAAMGSNLPPLEKEKHTKRKKKKKKSSNNGTRVKHHGDQESHPTKFSENDLLKKKEVNFDRGEQPGCVESSAVEIGYGGGDNAHKGAPPTGPNLSEESAKVEKSKLQKKKMVQKKISFYSLKDERSLSSGGFGGESSCALKSNETNSGPNGGPNSCAKKEYFFTYSPAVKKKRGVLTKMNQAFRRYFKSMGMSNRGSPPLLSHSPRYDPSQESTRGEASLPRRGPQQSEELIKTSTSVSNKNANFAHKFDNYNKKKLLKKLTSTLQVGEKKVSNFNRFYYKFNDEELEEEYTQQYYREIINIDLTKKLIIIFIISEMILSLCNVIELSYYEHKLKGNDFIVIIWLIRCIYLFIITFIWLLLKVKLKEYKKNSSKMMWTVFILNIFLSSWCIIIMDLSCIHYSNLVGNSSDRSLFFMKDATELIICMQLIFIKNMLFKHKFFFFVFFFVFLLYSFSKLFKIHLCEIRICSSILLILFTNILYFWYSEYLDRTQFLVKRRRNRMEKTSHDFLTRILPRQVLEEYQNDNLQLTYSHEKIAFLFADIVGFTRWSKTVPPKDVLKLLQKLISKIDKDTIKLGLYKLFTIGDAYVATSQPNSSITDEREAVEGILNIFKLAKLILHNINTIKIQFNKHDFNMRIGLHYGSCVGGIIGSVRIRYDMWGLDVLIANKIESNGIPGEIICSEQFKSFFLDHEPQAKLNFWYYKTIYISDKDVKLYVIEDKNYEEDYDPKTTDYETLLKLRERKAKNGTTNCMDK
ncbi:guanylate cyclase, other [Plasmodium inui San Antonio 1]|uniref:Guanylate cyclase, other n=1 Tax=Plasmodium inui San Antonio 1 TaxID=1237626 RepID=W7ABM3_9APIC|nr:guanylate cyclase, other [Plasmodium inui San Antonio 1]EUD68693.1 guanylate cyclase, other [Plasmodium inui San Antonio 1]